MDQPGPAPRQRHKRAEFCDACDLALQNRTDSKLHIAYFSLSLFRCVYKDDLILSHQAQFFPRDGGNPVRVVAVFDVVGQGGVVLLLILDLLAQRVPLQLGLFQAAVEGQQSRNRRYQQHQDDEFCADACPL